MAHVIIRRYNTFFDHLTGVQFNPVLDRKSGLYIGLANVSDDLLPHFQQNSAYQVLTDTDLAELTTGISSTDVDENAADDDVSPDIFVTVPGQPKLS